MSEKIILNAISNLLKKQNDPDSNKQFVQENYPDFVSQNNPEFDKQFVIENNSELNKQFVEESRKLCKLSLEMIQV